MAYVPRLLKPEKGNPYYNTKANGGFSTAIKGKPTDPDCNVLANCVGYAYGRFNEIGGYGSCKYLAPVNAENFIQYAKGLEVGQEPKLGACMVWRKGNTLNGSDGAGHVAIVEKINSDGSIVTSESGYNSSKPFWTQIRKKGSGNWGASSSYTFLGFIYNPAVSDDDQVISNVEQKKEGVCTVEMRVVRKGDRGEDVRALQILLAGRGFNGKMGKPDGIFGPNTLGAVKLFQEKNKLDVDGIVGKQTWTALIGAK